MTEAQVIRGAEAIGANRIVKAAKRSMFGMTNEGFCLACKAAANEVEGDARGYDCEKCGKAAVYGAEELLLYVIA